uniref:G-protein coupled receptors family 1 profile domain-containing protein n=1 Tax=Ixodes ricinus TaxID=34613 RepID=A0A0K8RAD7_IXORI
MINLAVSDLLCVCTLPLRVVYYVHKGMWFFGDILCRLSTYALYVNLYCSIFFMTAMSFFRCIAIVFPVKNINLVTEKKAKFVCASIWVFVILTSSPFLMSKSYKDEKTIPSALSLHRTMKLRITFSSCTMCHCLLGFSFLLLL